MATGERPLSHVLQAGENFARLASARVESYLANYLGDLGDLVNLDSGTYDRVGVERVGAWVRARCRQWGAAITENPGGEYGDSFAATLNGAGMGSAVLIAHMDTVFPSGTAAARPFAVVGDRGLGPGTCDMKAGLLAGVYAIESLLEAGFTEYRSIRLVCTSDEEVGAPSSKAFVERMAEGADMVLVLEAGRENGDIVGQRRGGGTYRLTVTGRAAHAGVEPQKGRNAAIGACRQALALSALTDMAAGRTVNIGVIHAGTRPNIVPDHAEVEVDLRFDTAAGMEKLLASADLALAEAALEGTTYVWEPVQLRPPWERNAGTERLAARARDIAAALGFGFNAAATGGTSDGNFTATRGVPTLDGLGPVGGLDHGPDEYIEISSIAPRAALLAGLIATCGAPVLADGAEGTPARE
ncbi:MAG TPA: M20 family metallopeptidase [Ktedonobacterales bacterium]